MSLLLLNLILPLLHAQVEVGDDCTATTQALVTLGDDGLVLNDLESDTTSTLDVTSPSGQDISFLDTAVSTSGVCPGEGGAGFNCLYALYTLTPDDQLTLGYFLEDSIESGTPQTFGEVSIGVPGEFAFTSITFGADGKLYGIEGTTTGDVYHILLESGMPHHLEADGADDTICDTVVGEFGCYDTIFYNADDGLLYRISSGSSNILLCEVVSDECVTVANPGSICNGDSRITSATFVDEDSVDITCSVLTGNTTASSGTSSLLLDGDNAPSLSEDFETTSFDGVGIAYSSDAGYCAPDFDGESPIEPEDGDDDDDDSDSSDSSDSGSADNAKAVFANLVDEETQETQETNNNNEVSITYVVSMSNRTMTMAWLMFGICMLMNMTFGLCLWKRNKQAQVVV